MTQIDEVVEQIQTMIREEIRRAVEEALKEEDRKFEEWLLYGDRGKDG